MVGYGNAVKIADFGMSRYVSVDADVYISQNSIFPVKWSPPEVINSHKFSSKSDVWSFGVLMWEVWTLGAVPCPTVSNIQFLQMVNNGYRLEKPPLCSIHLYMLIRQCWQYNPEDRPDFSYLLGQLSSHQEDGGYDSTISKCESLKDVKTKY